MQLLSVLLVVALCGGWAALGVQVKAGNWSFPLEAVKRLKGLMDLEEGVADTSVAALCLNPLLPQIFQPVCRGKGAEATFSQLETVLKYIDPCEICANPACYGCVI